VNKQTATQKRKFLSALVAAGELGRFVQGCPSLLESGFIDLVDAVGLEIAQEVLSDVSGWAPSSVDKFVKSALRYERRSER